MINLLGSLFYIVIVENAVLPEILRRDRVL